MEWNKMVKILNKLKSSVTLIAFTFTFVFCLAAGAETNVGPGSVSSVAPIGNLSSSLNLVLFGDSITQGSDSNTYGVTACTTACGTYIAGSFGTWLNYYSNIKRVPNTNNFGVSGDLTSNMLARIGPVLASNPNIVVLEGGTNDVAADDTCADIVTNLRSMYAQFLSSGVVVIRPTIFPRGSTEAFTTDQAEVANCVNDADRAYAMLPSSRGFYLVDLDDVMADPAQSTWTVRTNYLQDGVHPSEIGGSAMAYAIAQSINALVPTWLLLPQTNSDAFDATNNTRGSINTNPTMRGTGGTLSATGCTGTVSTGYILDCTFNGGVLTAVGSQTTGSNGGTIQNIAITGTTSVSATAIYVDSYDAISPTIFSVGDMLQMCAWVNVGSNTGIGAVTVEFQTTENNINYFQYGGLPSNDNTQAIPPGGFANGFVEVCSPIRTLAYVPSAVFSYVIVTATESSSVSGTVQIEGVTFKKIQN